MRSQRRGVEESQQLSVGCSKSGMCLQVPISVASGQGRRGVVVGILVDS